MAKDDYHVIGYQILEYFFPNINGMDIFRERANINKIYWQYILIHLFEDNYIEEASILPILL